MSIGKLRFLKLNAAIVVLALFSSHPALGQTCTVSASTASIDTSFDSIFTQNGPGSGLEPSNIPGWTGADSTYSIQLPDGDTAFFFSDSYIGQSPMLSGDGTGTTNSNGLRTRTSNDLYAHNSIVIRNASTGTLTTLTGPPQSPPNPAYSTSYISPTTSGHWFWMGDSFLINTAGNTYKLFLFLMEWDSSLNFYGTSIAQLSVPSLSVDSVQALTNDPWGGPSSDPVHWGAATEQDGSCDSYSLYIYGIEDYHPAAPYGWAITRYPHIARLNSSVSVSLSNLANMNNWQTYNLASGWTSTLTNTSRIVGDASDPNNADDSIGEEYTLKKIASNAGTTYLLVSEDTNPSKYITTDQPPGFQQPEFVSNATNVIIYSACNPQGPFSAKQVVYSTPETWATTVPGMTSGQSLSGHLWMYNPHAHPQFNSNGELLVSYDINSDDGADLIYVDAYRPKFIRVPITGLQ
jgi:hypothetical protein